MNTKKISKIKFNKRQIWQVAFTAMTASALMAVEKEVPELVQKVKEVIVQEELKEVIVEKEVSELVQEELKKPELVQEELEVIIQEELKEIMEKLRKEIIKSTVEEIKKEQGMLIQRV